MGYTHYHYQTQSFSDQQWSRLTALVNLGGTV